MTISWWVHDNGRVHAHEMSTMNWLYPTSKCGSSNGRMFPAENIEAYDVCKSCRKIVAKAAKKGKR